MLKKLPAELQAAICEKRSELGLFKTVAWLKSEHGINTNHQSLSEFCSWYAYEQQFAEADSDTDQLMERLRKKRPELSEAQIEAFGFEYFQAQSIKLKDPKMFLRFRTARFKAEMEKQKFAQKERGLAQREEALKLEREKFEFDAAEACLKKLPELRAIAANNKLSNTDKIQEIRRRLFGALPAEAPVISDPQFHCAVKSTAPSKGEKTSFHDMSVASKETKAP